MPADFYMAVPHLSRSLTVFADENQRISERQSTLDDIRSRTRITNEVHLQKNYRNTLEIAKVARAFYTGPESKLPDLPDREGRKPVAGQTHDVDDFVDFLVNYEKLYSDQDIGVLTQTRYLQKKIEKKASGKTKNKVQYYRRERNKDVPSVDFDEPGIRLVTFKSAKGLEFDVVFIPELQRVNLDPEDPATKMKFYVLVSRAREELFITYSGEERPELLDLFPEDLMEWRE
jgi:superfamily I DNA/RNA helicase